ncbi:hypothetical protein PUN28_013708 [Cardiocondyla obscurior]|uniref:Uncharacterized protein n=1 Tax=Cardiocondyla obscurior TaxID=286306 RepID=A0AAW2F6W5_9HYME
MTTTTTTTATATMTTTATTTTTTTTTTATATATATPTTTAMATVTTAQPMTPTILWPSLWTQHRAARNRRCGRAPSRRISNPPPPGDSNRRNTRLALSIIS